MGADALSDVLKTVRLTGAAFFDVAARAPWVAEQPPREAILAKILPGAGHLIAYHVVTEGRCFANIIGGSADRGGSRRSHRLHQRRSACRVQPSRHARRRRARRARSAAAGIQLPFFVNYGGEGPISARFVCGYPCLRRPAVQSASRQSAAGHQGWRLARRRFRLAWPVHPSGDGGIGGQARWRRKRAGETERIDVHRGGCGAICERCPGTNGMARGAARPVRRQGVVVDARGPRAQLDHRRTGAGGRPVALGAGRAISPASSACRRCNISPNGGCRSLRDF